MSSTWRGGGSGGVIIIADGYSIYEFRSTNDCVLGTTCHKVNVALGRVRGSCVAGKCKLFY